MYTTHGYITTADYKDHSDLYDLNAWRDEFNPDCPGHDTETDGFVDYCQRDEECSDAEGDEE